ncbi:nucleotidyltransferase domain-containing protein [Streptomyces sp. ISL-1]|nr:nucleotidyltransferase domain-containing protein [Streptomyces sp. ISL-1]
MNSRIEAMAQQLTAVRGVRAVALGGSRARGSHRPDSDWDLGVYYRGSVDTGALASLAAEVTGRPVEVAGPGGWGPWVNGGAWLSVDEMRVDWILRDLDRVQRVWADCRTGRYGDPEPAPGTPAPRGHPRLVAPRPGRPAPDQATGTRASYLVRRGDPYRAVSPPAGCGPVPPSARPSPP